MNALENNEYLISRVVNVMRFPLVVLVVFIHVLGCIMQSANVPLEGMPLFNSFAYFFSQIVARTAVPLFFAISGFYFFHKVDSFSIKVYGNKVRKRIKTLLIPYIIWNLIVIVAYLLMQITILEFWGVAKKTVLEYTWRDWLFCFWDMRQVDVNGSPLPINYPLWYIRDLMVLVVLSPVIFAAVKYLKWFFLIAVGMVWLLGIPGCIGFGFGGLFDFSLGAFLALRQPNWIASLRNKRWICLSYLGLAIVELLFRDSGTWVVYLHRLNILWGMVAVVQCALWCMEKFNTEACESLSKASLFVFFYHELPLVFVVRIMWMLLAAYVSDFTLIMIYVLSSFIVIVIGVYVYKLLTRVMPGVMSVLMGGR